MVIISRFRFIPDYFRSLKFRILIVVLILGLSPLFIMKEVFLQRYTTRAINVRMTDIQGQCNILASQLVSSGYIYDHLSESISEAADQIANLYDGRTVIIDQDFRIIKDSFGLEQGKLMISEEVIKCFKGENTSHLAGSRFIEMTIPVLANESQTVIGVILMSASTDSIYVNRDYLSSHADTLIVIFAVVLLFLTIFITWLLLRPLGKVQDYLEAFALGHEADEMEINSYTETRNISVQFNRSIEQMRVIDESRQEFVSNVSHELKTPLTSMKIIADQLNMSNDVPVELYRDFMTDIASEIDRENSIITDLLSLVKLDKKAAEMNITQVDINQMLERILKRLRPIAEKKNIEVTLESVRPVTAEIDETKLALAFSNLVENAIKYNHDSGWVNVSVDADHKYFYVKVSDSGIGISEEARQHIFERFYRADKSHSREIGGTGLGLAITKSTVQLHKGAIRVTSEPGEGSEFTVRIPLNYIS